MMMSMTTQYDVRRLTPSDIYRHLPRLFETACRYPAPRIIELGVRSGNSTSAFLAAIEHQGGGYLHSVDINVPQVPQGWFSLPYWTFTRQDDRRLFPLTYDPACVGVLAEHDVLFIDTSHEYEHTIAELDLWVPMIRPGGTVLLHDTEWAGMDVARALNDWCPKHDLEWFNYTGNNGLGEIRIPAGD